MNVKLKECDECELEGPASRLQLVDGKLLCEECRPPADNERGEALPSADELELAAQGLNDAFAAQRWTDAQNIASQLLGMAGRVRRLTTRSEQAVGDAMVERAAEALSAKMAVTPWADRPEGGKVFWRANARAALTAALANHGERGA